MTKDCLYVSDFLLRFFKRSTIIDYKKNDLRYRYNDFNNQGIVKSFEFGSDFKKKLDELHFNNPKIHDHGWYYSFQGLNKAHQVYGFCDITEWLTDANGIGRNSAFILLKCFLNLYGIVRIAGVDIVNEHELKAAIKKLPTND